MTNLGVVTDLAWSPIPPGHRFRLVTEPAWSPIPPGHRAREMTTVIPLRLQRRAPKVLTACENRLLSHTNKYLIVF